LKNFKSYFFFGIILVLLGFTVSVGYGAQPITLLTVRYSSYPEEQKTRVAFDFSGGLPNFSYNTDLEKNEIRFNFENIQAAKGTLETFLIQDERIDNLSVKETEKGIEVVTVVKIPCEITEGKIQKTTLYFDLTENLSLADNSTSLPEETTGFGKITGKIYDNLSGKTISGVKISIVDQNQQTISNDNGSYFFQNILAGQNNPDQKKTSLSLS
jgi:hypothetical protein